MREKTCWSDETKSVLKSKHYGCEKKVLLFNRYYSIHAVKHGGGSIILGGVKAFSSTTNPQPRLTSGQYPWADQPFKSHRISVERPEDVQFTDGPQSKQLSLRGSSKKNGRISLNPGVQSSQRLSQETEPLWLCMSTLRLLAENLRFEGWLLITVML